MILVFLFPLSLFEPFIPFEHHVEFDFSMYIFCRCINYDLQLLNFVHFMLPLTYIINAWALICIFIYWVQGNVFTILSYEFSYLLNFINPEHSFPRIVLFFHNFEILLHVIFSVKLLKNLFQIMIQLCIPLSGFIFLPKMYLLTYEILFITLY